MKIIINSFLVVCILITAMAKLTAQTIMHIGDGGNMYIHKDAAISLDSLVLQPSANFLLTANSINKSRTVTHVATGNYISRVYSFSTPVTNYNGNIAIFYKEDELNGLDKNTLVLEAYNNSNWQTFTNPVTRSSMLNFVNTIGITNIGLDELTLASSNSVLPLKWISVEVTRENNVTLIKWITANEVSSRYYQVQKSDDATIWTNVGNLIAATNHTALNDYLLTDASFLNGTAYYRIVQMDANGKLNYSSIVSVKNILNDDISVYPIPAISVVNVKANNNTTIKRIKLFDAAGKLLMVKEGTNNVLYSFSISNLASGFYLISIETSNGKTTKGFMKK